MRHGYGTIATAGPLRLIMALYAALLVMVPEHVAVPPETPAVLADLAGASDDTQDAFSAFSVTEESDDTTASKPDEAAASRGPWRAQPAPPGAGGSDAMVSDFIADLVRTFGWQPLICLGSFAGALFVMLIAWWRITRAVTLDNRHRPPDWDMY